MDIIEELYNTPNIDRFGLLTEANGDGGDTVHRAGALMFAIVFMQALLLSEVSFPTIVSKLAISVFKRLPKLEAASTVNSVQQRLNHYTRDGGVAVLARAFEPVTEHFFA